MLTVCTTLLMAAGTEAATKFITNLTAILTAGVTFLAILKLAPLLLRGKATQIITAIAVGAIIIYFANNTGAFTSIGTFFAGLFK